MNVERVFWPLALSALLTACSGSLGGGQSTLPGMPQTGTGTNVQQVAQAAPTPTPVAASNVATLGDSVAPQSLPEVMGWGGSITFAKPVAAPSPTPNPKATATPNDVLPQAPMSIGITASVVEPSDAPHLGPAKHAKHDASAVTALFFISLLAPSDVTLPQYPAIAVDVPRDIAAKHRDDTFALALYDPEQKEKAYRLSVAERDFSSPPPGTLQSAPTPVPTPTLSPTPFGMPNGPGALTPPPVGSGLGSASLPPERVAFKSTAATLTLQANRPVVFALYAVPPQPSPSPSPSATPSARASGSPLPVPSGSSAPATASPAAQK